MSNNVPSDIDLRTFFELSPSFLAKLDREGHILALNDIWYKHFDLSKEDALGHNFLDLVNESQRENLTRRMRAQLFDLIPITLEIEMRGKNEGKILEVMGILHGAEIFIFGNDVTERVISDKIREEQRQALEFRQIFEDTLTNISTRMINLDVKDLDGAINEILLKIGRLMGVDRSYVFLFDTTMNTMSNTHEWCESGITPEIENLQKLPIDIFPWWLKKLRNFEVINVPMVSKMPKEASTEKEMLEMQGIKSVMVVPIKRHTELIGFAGFDAVKKHREWSFDSISLMRIVGDILSNALTRIYYEGILRESRQKSTAILRALPDVILTLNGEGKLLTFQPSLDDGINKSFEKIEKNPLKLFTTQVDYESFLKAVKKTLKTNSINSITFKFDSDEVSRYLEARIMQVGENEVMALIRDVSEQIRLEEMKSDFINKATHELRTPVATMLLMINLIEDAESQAKKDEYWQILKGELSREKLLIDDLLTAGRLESQQQKFILKNIDFAEVIRDITSKAQIQANEKNISLRLTMHGGRSSSDWIIESDEGALNQIFVNLISNAIKFTNEQGKVNIDVNLDGQFIVIKIRDNGIGIPADDLPFLFSRFFRGRNALNQEIQGTGIGLFIVKTMVEKLAGVITVESQINAGTTFKVKLPKTQ